MLSDFLRRLERSLTKVVQRGGLPGHRADRACIDQLIRGAAESDIMLLQLRLRERKEKPPSFLKLLSEIREEEEYESARRKLTTSVRQVKVGEETKAKSTEVQELKVEIKELRSQLKELTNKRQETHTEPTSKATNKVTDTGAESEVQQLKQQVQQLQHQLSVMSVSHGASSTDSKKRDGRARYGKAPKPYTEKDQESFFCYRCGENGHIATHCIAPDNTSKVIQRLLGALRKSKEDKGASKESTESKGIGSVKKSSVHTPSSSVLPEGLVGPSMMADVTIERQPCRALLDSGSRVTIIFESWYSRYIPNVPILPLADLAIWGLSDSTYPYKGYVTVELGFPPSSEGAEEAVSILALVCPDPKSPDPVPAIVGTNSRKLHSLLTHCGEFKGRDEVHSLRIDTYPQNTSHHLAPYHQAWLVK